MRTTNVEDAILGGGFSPSRHEVLTDALRRWRRRVAYYSIFGAIPAMLTSNAQQALADEVVTKPVGAGQDLRVNAKPAGRSRINPAFYRRQADYRLPHQRGAVDIVSVLAGSDDCPGTPIPGGHYTKAAPYTDTGNTTGANDTVRLLYPYYFYAANGPDHVYSFTLTGFGPDPRIDITTASATYKPMVYVLQGNLGPCPSGTGRIASNLGGLDDTRWHNPPSSTATIHYYALENLPLNVNHYLFVDSQLDDAAGFGPYTLRMQDVFIAPSVPVPQPRTPFDFDGDGKADVAVFRPDTGIWYVYQSSAGPVGFAWGVSTDKIVPADYDRDGKTDIAVFRPSERRWHILNSYDSTVAIIRWGEATDIPTTGDFNFDGRADLALYRPSDGIWHVWMTRYSWSMGRQGSIDAVPVAGDYDGDGRADVGSFVNASTFAPLSRDWDIRLATGGRIQHQWGLATDKVVPADYDGDGKTDMAVYRPSEGIWYIRNSSGSPAQSIAYFGAAGDIPVPADYDGDGRADIAIFRPSDGTWWINRSTAGLVVIQWGQNGDRPAPAAFGN